MILASSCFETDYLALLRYHSPVRPVCVPNLSRHTGSFCENACLCSNSMTYQWAFTVVSDKESESVIGGRMFASKGSERFRKKHGLGMLLRKEAP